MDILHLLQQGETNLWVFLPAALCLGALHGLEPGHSKTLMAGFIIAVRGTVGQAVLLGLSAAVSHSLVIWLLAAAALHFGAAWNAEATEPYFQIASGVMIAGLAGWMVWRSRRDRAALCHHHPSAPEGPHGGQWVETAHGALEVVIFERDGPPRFRVYKPGQKLEAGQSLILETRRSEEQVETFTFFVRVESGEMFWESAEEIAEPHAFAAVLTLSHGDHSHAHELIFSEDDHHHHHHSADLADSADREPLDAHAQAHADEIARRFANRSVTTPQILWFGITGGLMPCPAAFTILVVCLQLKRFTLGFSLVAGFSLGLAITMVASGVLAAWGLRHAERRFKRFGEFAKRAPYLSAVVLAVLAAFLVVSGVRHLSLRE